MDDKEKIKITITDDHKLIAESLAETLAREGVFEILWISGSGPELLSRLQNSPVKPDVFLLDISMKPMNGFEVLEELKKWDPNVKTLAVTMNGDDNTIERILASGFNGIVLKDDETSTLVKAIESVYAKGMYSSDLTTRILLKMARNPGSTLVSPEKLSEREVEFLKLCASEEEYTYKQIAEMMGISIRTVEHYRETLGNKLGVKGRVGLIAYYYRMNTN